MSLTTIPTTPPTPAEITTAASNQIRGKLGQVVTLAGIRLQEIRNIVREHTRAAIAAELSSDAAAMLTVYTKLKEAVEVAKEIEVDDLP